MFRVISATAHFATICTLCNPSLTPPHSYENNKVGDLLGIGNFRCQ